MNNCLSLEIIQEMWNKDSKIDIDNLHNESLNIPSLHAKYFELYNQILLLKKRAEKQRIAIRHQKYEYFTGKADPEVYQENPFPKKIRDKEILNGYLESDEKVHQVTLKVEYYDAMLKYLEDILKMISNRSFQIKNCIDFLSYSCGARF